MRLSSALVMASEFTGNSILPNMNRKEKRLFVRILFTSTEEGVFESEKVRLG